MPKRIADIAELMGLTVEGNGDLLVNKPAEPKSAGPDDLALAMSEKFSSSLSGSQAKTAVLWADADWASFGLEAAILVQRPRLAMAHLTQGFDVTVSKSGRSKFAEISNKCVIGDGSYIGAFATIGEGVAIGKGCQISDHVSIAEGVKVGHNCILHAGVRIGRNVEIGDNVIIQPNAVIGGDGFSFVTEGLSNEERAFGSLGRKPLSPPEDARRHRIHSLGGVRIGDDVEIGANSTVDAGTIRPTTVGRGTKVDNLVQVGHNVMVGEDCVLCAQTAIAGSSVIGDRCVLGGKSGVKDNVRVGNDVVLGGAAIVLNDVEDGRFMMGYPAVEMPDYRAQVRGLRSLPGLLKTFRSN